MPLAIRIDRAACQGARACLRRAPRTFALGEDRKSRVVDPRGDDEATIRAAAAACPYFAIDLVETADAARAAAGATPAPGGRARDRASGRGDRASDRGD